MIDLALLRIIKHKEAFLKVYRYIPVSGIDKRTRAIADDINKYFEDNPEETKLDFPAFRSMFFTTWHRGMKDDDVTFYNSLLDRMETDVSDSIRKNIVNQLLRLEFATDVANVIQDYNNEEEVEIVEAVENLLRNVKTSMETSTNCISSGYEDASLFEEVSGDGLMWPLPVMNNYYNPIESGEQYIIAARPGKGKTSFLTFLMWSIVQQLPENKTIVWFNNEGRRQRIVSRQIASALNATKSELYKMKEDGTLGEKYLEAMKGDRVQVYDVHGKNNFYLEEILEDIGLDNVGAIIFDMLDNVKFPTRRDLREDQRLEMMYQWARELAVRYKCPSFPTSQISNEGAGLLFPSEGMLKDSKTGKQGACDGIIMIGSSDDPLLQHVRGLSMPKTKSKKEGMDDMREEVLFDADRGRFK